MTPLVMYLSCKNLACADKSLDISTLLEGDAIHRNFSEMIGMGLGYDIMDIILAFEGRCIEEELYEQDEVTGLYPFMLAASSGNNGLYNLYCIARKTPSLLKKTQTL